jgi:hypothetical protein
VVVHGGQSSDGQLHHWNNGTDIVAELWLTINEPLRHLWQTSKLTWSVSGSAWKGRCRHSRLLLPTPNGGLSDLSGCNSPPPPPPPPIQSLLMYGTAHVVRVQCESGSVRPAVRCRYCGRAQGLVKSGVPTVVSSKLSRCVLAPHMWRHSACSPAPGASAGTVSVAIGAGWPIRF